MGKMTGFLDYGREVSAETAARDRIKNWNEFHTPLSGEEQRKQGARCMECGVPFCQSGVMMKGIDVYKRQFHAYVRGDVYKDN